MMTIFNQALLNLKSFQLGLFLLYVWSVIIKGIALWHAAKNGEKYWFIAILVLNTLGILEILYLFVFAKPKFKTESLVKVFKR